QEIYDEILQVDVHHGIDGVEAVHRAFPAALAQIFEQFIGPNRVQEMQAESLSFRPFSAARFADRQETLTNVIGPDSARRTFEHLERILSGSRTDFNDALPLCHSRCRE